MHKSLVGQQVLLVGPGWLGRAAAEQLRVAGATVWTLQRSAPSAVGYPTSDVRFGLQGDIRDGTRSTEWQSLLPDRLNAVIVTVAPSRTAGDSHELTYPASVRGALQLAGERRCDSLVYTSSTGVYGRTDGGQSREDDVIAPRDPRQQALRDAELILENFAIASDVQRTVLRVAGLYGPGRDPSPRFQQTVPTGDADVWCNFSWRDDVIDALAHVLSMAQSGARKSRAHIYNCADGVPLRASTIARAFGASESPALPMAAAHSPTGRSNQQILVNALRATGWTPQMRSVFQGLRALGHDITEPADLLQQREANA